MQWEALLFFPCFSPNGYGQTIPGLGWFGPLTVCYFVSLELPESGDTVHHRPLCTYIQFERVNHKPNTTNPWLRGIATLMTTSRLIAPGYDALGSNED